MKPKYIGTYFDEANEYLGFIPRWVLNWITNNRRAILRKAGKPQYKVPVEFARGAGACSPNMISLKGEHYTYTLDLGKRVIGSSDGFTIKVSRFWNP